MSLSVRQVLRSGVLVAVLAAGLAIVVGAGVSAQSVSGVVVRDRLIADQENLLNTYRCLFGVDVGVVPGGCGDRVVVSPAAAPQFPTQRDLDVRDGLIGRQEALLNTYRCRFDVDTEIVAGGCGDEGESELTPGTGTDPGGGSESSVVEPYGDVGYTYWHEIEERVAGVLYDTVNRLRALGVFEGTDCGENLFCPDDPVDGATFAIWLVRALGEAAATASGATAHLVELGAAEPCSGQPAGLCPGEEVSRAKMAAVVSPALNLPESDPIGFWDVEKDDRHFDSINSLVESGIDDGCGELRFVPFDFCPSQTVSRADLAMMLPEVIDYVEASKVINITSSQTERSVNLSVDYEWETADIDISWNNPSNSKSVSHYVLQWKPYWQDFNYKRYQVVDFKQGGNYSVEFPSSRDAYKGRDKGYASNLHIYAFRVIIVYSDNNQQASNEVKVPNRNHRLRDNIESLVSRRGQDQPWLVDTWRHLI